MTSIVEQLEQEIAKHEAETDKLREALSILKGNAPQVKGYAYSETDNGDDFYFNEDGQYHRTDGPAIEFANGDKEWWLNGKLHRTDGPAAEYANGHKEWWLNGEEYTKKEFNAEIVRRKSEGTL